MGFANDTGYVPSTIEQLMEVVRVNVNEEFGTTYIQETFIGTNWYKFFYSLMQMLQENEVKTSEIFLKMQQYFTVTNERVLRPNTTHPGIYDYFLAAGYLASTKAPSDTDRGKLFVCVDVEDSHARGNYTITNYANLLSGTPDTVAIGATLFTAQAGAAVLGEATFQAATSTALTAASLATQINHHATAGALVEAEAQDSIVYIRAKNSGAAGNSIALDYDNNDGNVGATKSGVTLLGGFELEEGDVDYDIMKPEICSLIKDCCVAGVVSQGNEIETITLDNGQSFDFKFKLPTRIPTLLRLTTTLSENNLFTIGDPADVKAELLANIEANYRLGKNFEPQRYYSVVNAPWASEVLLEYSLNDGADWLSAIYDSDYDVLLTFDPEDVEILEE